MDCIFKHTPTWNITETRDLTCAAAVLVCERVGAKEKCTKKKVIPWWKRRIEGDILLLKKYLSKFEML